MATILDVSRRAGVSKTTVSRVMNGKGRISQATRDAVFKAIADLDYRPNVLAQSLSNQTTNSIGLIIPSGYHRSQYIMGLMDLAHTMATQANKFLIVTQTDANNTDSGIRTIKELVDRRCDGILYYKTSHIEKDDNDIKLAQLIDELPIPLVVLNHQLPTKPDNYVWFDQVNSGRLAIDKLIALGHRKIAYLCGPLHINTARQRFMGYQQALKAHGIPFDPLLVVEAAPFLEGGHHACEQLLQRQVPFTAIACYNDAIAVGTLKALTNKGISVPDDVSLFGFDNEDISSYTQPAISSVELPVHNMVQHACDMLFYQIEHKAPPETPFTDLQAKIVLRESVQQLNVKR